MFPLYVVVVLFALIAALSGVEDRYAEDVSHRAAAKAEHLLVYQGAAKQAVRAAPGLAGPIPPEAAAPYLPVQYTGAADIASAADGAGTVCTWLHNASRQYGAVLGGIRDGFGAVPLNVGVYDAAQQAVVVPGRPPAVPVPAAIAALIPNGAFAMCSRA